MPSSVMTIEKMKNLRLAPIKFQFFELESTDFALLYPVVARFVEPSALDEQMQQETREENVRRDVDDDTCDQNNGEPFDGALSDIIQHQACDNRRDMGVDNRAE